MAPVNDFPEAATALARCRTKRWLRREGRGSYRAGCARKPDTLHALGGFTARQESRPPQMHVRPAGSASRLIRGLLFPKRQERILAAHHLRELIQRIGAPPGLSGGGPVGVRFAAQSLHQHQAAAHAALQLFAQRHVAGLRQILRPFLGDVERVSFCEASSSAMRRTSQRALKPSSAECKVRCGDYSEPAKICCRPRPLPLSPRIVGTRPKAAFFPGFLLIRATHGCRVGGYVIA